MEWIRTANLKKYDVVQAFKKKDHLDWVKSGFDIAVGDTVYIYVGKPYSKIMYKTSCVASHVEPAERIDDREFWGNPKEFNLQSDRIRLSKIASIDSPDLSIETFHALNLVKNTIQGAYKSANYPALFSYIRDCFSEYKRQLLNDQIDEICNDELLDATEKDALVKMRVGQGYFKDKLLMKYQSKCVLCGLACKELLVASHIRPWAESAGNERLDVNNGLLLCVTHDALFDKHLISFDQEGHIAISQRLSKADQKLLQIDPKVIIPISDAMKPYMTIHYGRYLEKEKIH